MRKREEVILLQVILIKIDYFGFKIKSTEKKGFKIEIENISRAHL